MDDYRNKGETSPEWLADFIDMVYDCVDNWSLGLISRFIYDPLVESWDIEVCPAPFDQESDPTLCLFDMIVVNLSSLSELFDDTDDPLSDVELICDRESVCAYARYMGEVVTLTIYFDPQTTASRGKVLKDGSHTLYPKPIERNVPSIPARGGGPQGKPN